MVFPAPESFWNLPKTSQIRVFFLLFLFLVLLLASFFLPVPSVPKPFGNLSSSLGPALPDPDGKPDQIVEGSLEVKLPTIWTAEKHSQEEAQPGRNWDVEKVRREKMRDGESQKREDAGARKVGETRNSVFFQ